ncbi:MAG: DUF1990 domain-containing protein [Planctomycetes bacterium]|nr:DUF1990 domain-containing protein [Planctomycetota bacterium]
MLHIRRPSPQQIRALLDSQADLSVSYDPEIARQAWAGLEPEGLKLRQYRVLLGHGAETFAAAREAIDSWRMFPRAMTTPWPDRVPIAVGHDVAILCRTWGLWSILPSRIVAVHHETGTVETGNIERYGFTYGTLPAHLECGEERFTVAWQRDTDEVWYELAAFSRNQWWLAKVGRPFVRYQQKRFCAESLQAMAAALKPKTFEPQRHRSTEKAKSGER